ncbi:MAG: class I SAM-dependent methyltransferase [Planctomycetaceae bacterium]|nr:class I SAM-dependent methyltransferase [Planctomycetaceae bacterium]
MSRPLLDDQVLEWSETVANCRMNRERELCGTNGYTAELPWNPLDLLEQRLGEEPAVSWLDLCCGTGRALLQAGASVASSGLAGRVTIHGIDLVDQFAVPATPLPHVRLECASLHRWEPEQAYDLITCVHGLHYIGDKLDLIARAVSWLKPEGRFVAHLDLRNLAGRHGDWTPAANQQKLREQGLQYDVGTRLVSARGRCRVRFPFRYAGADDQAGPNFTGQPAVTSWYTTSPDAPSDEPPGTRPDR